MTPFACVRLRDPVCEFRRLGAAPPGRCGPAPAPAPSPALAAAPPPQGDAAGSNLPGTPASLPPETGSTPTPYPENRPAALIERPAYSPSLEEARSLAAAETVLSLDAAVDLAASSCREAVPTHAMTIRLARDSWRARHADLVSQAGQTLRSISDDARTKQITEQAKNRGAELLTQLRPPGREALSAWCAEADRNFSVLSLDPTANENHLALRRRPN